MGDLKEAKGPKSLKALAKEELQDECKEEAVKALKNKLRQLKDARVIVSNLEREVESLEEELVEELNAFS